MRRRALTLIALPLAALSVVIAGASNAGAAGAWWIPVALRGETITQVSAIGDNIVVRTGAGATLMSSDGGRTFAPVPGAGALPPTGTAVAGNQAWTIDPTGRILHNPDLARRSAAAPDPGAPDLGAGANLIAAPAAVPGVVVAVSKDGTVWRRGQDGDWQRALLLLPASLVQGVPRITSATAFSTPITDAVYLGTDGYAVLISTNGGDDWIRAGPGLPNSVFSLSADSARRAVFAATSDGLWEHVLQTFPAPPAYRDAALVWRWIGIGAITLVASAIALLGMIRLVPRRVTERFG